VFSVQVEAGVTVAEPMRACEPLINAAELIGKIVVVERGDCMFVEKVRCIQTIGDFSSQSNKQPMVCFVYFYF